MDYLEKGRINTVPSDTESVQFLIPSTSKWVPISSGSSSEENANANFLLDDSNEDESSINFRKPISPTSITLRSQSSTAVRQTAKRTLQRQDNSGNIKATSRKRLLRPIPEITKRLNLRSQKEENELTSVDDVEESVSEEPIALEDEESEHNSTSEDSIICKGHYRINRITDWRISQSNGLLEFFVEWDQYPAENTWEELYDIGATEKFVIFENKLVDCFNAIKHPTVVTEKDADNILRKFSSIFNHFLQNKQDEQISIKALPFIKLLIPGRTLNHFQPKKQVDSAKLFERIVNQLKLEYKPFTDRDTSVYKEDNSKLCKLKNRAVLFMLYKKLKTSNLDHILNCVEVAKETEVHSKNRFRKLKAKAENDCELRSYENIFDYQLLPKFKYASDYFTSRESPSNTSSPINCKADCPCTKAESPIQCPCLLYPESFKAKFSSIYKDDNERTVNIPTKVLFECNDSCLCSSSCKNRLASIKSPYSFTIFKTEDRGWGLKTCCAIPKGAFVLRLTGQLKSVTQMIQEQNLKNEWNTYAFALDGISVDPSHLKVVDASTNGNLSRFINHSCDPNLIPYFVFYGNYDLTAPRIALFAKKNIRPNTELTFSYPEQSWRMKCEKKFPPIICKCNSFKCQKYLVGILE